MKRRCDATDGDSYLNHCSDDRIEVWHGHETPAYGCGFHVTYDFDSVVRGHKVRRSYGET